MSNVTPWIERVHALSTTYENWEAMQSEIADLRTALTERDAEIARLRKYRKDNELEKQHALAKPLADAFRKLGEQE